MPFQAPEEMEFAASETFSVPAGMAGVGAGLYQNLSSLFMPGLQEVTGASRGEIGASAALGLLGALAAPFIGRLADRVGVVLVIVVSALVLGATHLWLSLLSGGLWQFQLGVALLALSAPGMSAMVYGRLVATRRMTRATAPGSRPFWAFVARLCCAIWRPGV
jgi:MFS family permease